MKKILRVFARQTSMTPIDELAYYDTPGLFVEEHDEVHIVVTFTWDLERGQYLKECWESVTDKPVRIGGPAFDDPCLEDFVPGLYLKRGVTVTSRGCVNACPFCFVPKREGRLREIENFAEGNIIQDNNFLACSKQHKRKVYDMLKRQRRIDFRGGLESEYLTDEDVEEMRGLSIASLWMACDSKARIKPFMQAIQKLAGGGDSHRIKSVVMFYAATTWTKTRNDCGQCIGQGRFHLRSYSSRRSGKNIRVNGNGSREHGADRRCIRHT